MGAPAASSARPTVLVRATAAEAAGAALKVAGLSVLERAVRQLRRMGHPVVLATDRSVALPAALPAGLDVRVVEDAAALAALRTSLAGPPEVAADVVRPANADLPGGLRVTDEASRRRAEDAIFAELLRGDLGLVARHLNKPISFRITRHLLCRLPVTPNQVTLGAAAVGLAGCALVATGAPGLVVLGLLLAHVQSVLDGCDGELARVRFQQSPIGEWLDTVVDDALNLALFAAVGVGLARASGSGAALAVAAVACGMLLTYNVVAYRELVRQGQGGEVLKVRWWFAAGTDLKALYGSGGKTSRFRWLLSAGRRDFFLAAWVVLAAAGLFPLVLAWAFVVAAASFVVAVGQIASRRGRT